MLKMKRFGCLLSAIVMAVAMLYGSDPVTFTALQGTSTVKMVRVGNPDRVLLQYSTDSVNWHFYEIGKEIKLSGATKSVSFKAISTNLTFSRNEDNYYKFQMTGKVAASGDVSYLLDERGAFIMMPPFTFCRLFEGCKTLTEAPELPDDLMSPFCYCSMFEGCTSLQTAPQLPSVKLAQGCYYNMFGGCESLVNVPYILPATVLAPSCYAYMFASCTSLRVAPGLPAEEMKPYCYAGMFTDCRNLINIHLQCADWDPVALRGWVAGVSPHGVICCSDKFPRWEGENCIPAGWKMSGTPKEVLCFTANKSFSSVMLRGEGNPHPVTLQYSSDGKDWQPYEIASVVTLRKAGDRVYFKAMGQNAEFSKSSDDYYRFVLSGSVACSGNVMYLFDEKGVRDDVPNYAFNRLFASCRDLTSAPALPAGELGAGCYSYMFASCTNLEAAPKLASTKINANCYQGMFSWCSNLVAVPDTLPATELKMNCYVSMFANCTNLGESPVLPAARTPLSSYSKMFQNCSSLHKITVGLTEWGTGTFGWVNGVAEAGIFVCPEELANTFGADNIPTGWKLPAHQTEMVVKVDKK